MTTSNASSSSTNLDTGLRFVVEPSSTTLSSQEIDLLSELRPAGVMFRKRNILQDAPYDEWREALRALLASIATCISRDTFIVSVDHEGGRVMRYPPPISRFPYPAFYSSSIEAVRAVARSMAVELCSLGINVSYAPVADIHSNPQNPVINQRAFGQSAPEVAERAGVFARVLREGGIVPCAKHFPGHGDTGTDSHFSLPVVNRSLSELEERELAPFKALIDDGIEMVMSAHIVLPQLDPNSQSTLSSAVMRGLLRDRLGFKGVTIADALGMEAIRNDVGDESFAARATEAGTDLLLMVGDPVSIADAVSARRALDTAISEERVPLLHASEAQARVEALLATLPMHQVCKLPPSVIEEHNALAARLAAQVEWAEFDFERIGFE